MCRFGVMVDGFIQKLPFFLSDFYIFWKNPYCLQLLSFFSPNQVRWDELKAEARTRCDNLATHFSGAEALTRDNKNDKFGASNILAVWKYEEISL